MTGDEKLVDGQGAVLGASLAVTDPKSQSRALSLVGSVDWIQVREEPFSCFTGKLGLLTLCDYGLGHVVWAWRFPSHADLEVG